MKQLIILGFIVAIAISGCKKDIGPLEKVLPQPINNFFPLKVGNYWIYQSVNIDTNGIETINPILDSVYVKKDSLINGKLYYEMWGVTWLNAPFSIDYLRDSAGFIVSYTGRKLFTPIYNDYLLSFDTADGSYGIYRYMTGESTVISVPAGIFLTKVRRQKTIWATVYPWNNPRYNDTYYHNGIGIVKEQQYWSLNPDNIEGRLLRYFVQ